LDRKGITYEKRFATPEEYKLELIKKLEEEAKEFSEAGDPEELADIIEVVEALKCLPDYANVEELRKKKAQERGAFDKRTREKSRNKRTTLEFGRFRNRVEEIERRFKAKPGSRTRINKELDLSNIRMRNRLWICVSGEEETNKPIGIFN